MGSKKRKIIFSLSVIVLMAIIIPNISYVNFNHDISKKTNFLLKKSGYWMLNFIHIDGNWSETAALPAGWCNGDGSWQNPFLIENITIDAISSLTGSGIFINNSKNEYFIIRNCTIYNAGSMSDDAGIKLQNTNNGTLINNNCSQNGENGIIMINNCINNTISGNKVNDNGYSGIYIDNNCDNNTLLGNTANNKFTLNQFNGIFLDNSVNNTLSLNIANNNSQYGILFNQNSNNNRISENILNNNGFAGILFDTTCMNNTVLENTIYNNGQNGIITNDGCDNNKIIKNYLYFNKDDAIEISGSNNDDNLIKQNVIVSIDHSFIRDLGTNTFFESNWYLSSIPRLFIEIINQSFSTTEFYIVLDISSQCIGLDISLISFNAWWDGDNVTSNNIDEIEKGVYKIFLTPVFVESKGDLVKLDLEIKAPHHEIKYYEIYLEPHQIEEERSLLDNLLVIILSIISGALIIVIIILIKNANSMKKRLKLLEVDDKLNNSDSRS